jgi:hypothetical protein
MARRVSRDKSENVMTPVLLQQFRLFYDTDVGPPPAGRQTHRCPVAGRRAEGAQAKDVSEEVEAMLARGTTKLRPQDWKSGDQPSSSAAAPASEPGGAVGQGRLWVVEVVAPFGGAEEMVKDLKANVHPGRETKFLAVGRDGKREVKTW